MSKDKEAVTQLFLARLSLLMVLLLSALVISSAQGFRVESKSPIALTGSESFSSLDGRFSISLPRQISGYTPEVIESPAGRIESVRYDWNLADGVFFVGYLTRPEKTLGYANKTVLDNIRNSILSASRAKLASETEIKLLEYGGRELKLEFPNGFAIARIYVVLNRVYQVIASLPSSFKSHEPVTALRILNSFHILSPTEIDTELKRKVAEAGPSPLPQAPVVGKFKSDAQDEGLRGRVKTVNAESEDLSGTWMVSARKPTSMKHYNQLGNLTESDSFDYRGNPFEITVYGYVNGFRVSNVNEVEYEYNPPPIVVAGPPAKSKVKSDPAYRYRHMYKYDEIGRLNEELTFESNGRPLTKIAYVYSGNQKQELTYDDEGKLNQKSVTTFDAAGNEIEEVDFEITDGSVKEKYRYSYEFDSQGNWIKQTTSKWVTKDGTSSYLPYSIDYRTITYY